MSDWKKNGIPGWIWAALVTTGDMFLLVWGALDPDGAGKFVIEASTLISTLTATFFIPWLGYKMGGKIIANKNGG